ncbi:glycosyltransferase family 2 protein [Methylomagnum sp.]
MTTQARVPDPADSRQAKGHHGMALGWLKRGRYKQAVVSLEKALAADPNYLEAHLELARVYLHMRRWDDLITHCRRGFLHFMETSELHKMLMTALEEQGTLDDAYACYGLERRDERCLDIGPDEILCCLVARNERPRLPFFLEYYRQLGVDRFFVIDNGSTDGSVEWLLQQPGVHVWCSELSFKRANFGSSWFELLLRRYGVGHWCLTLDSDEFMIFEGSPRRSLKDFCRDLDRRDKRVATGLLLDLYGQRPVSETRYQEGTDPLSLCQYFDRKFYHTLLKESGPYRSQDLYFGGARQRVFPTKHDYLLTKSVLLRYQPDVVLAPGQHLSNIAVRHHATHEICLLHFKFFASFLGYAREEAKREVHAMGAEQYKAYQRRLDEEENLVLYHPDHSLRFEGTAQLRELGIMRAEEPLPPAPEFPAIAPLSDGEERPFWSVMVSVYERPQTIERVLSSVLRQADEAMQIEVVCDFSGAERQAAIGAEVARVGGGRVGFFPLPVRVGHPHIFNACIARARGQWVHILHDDDWVEPGFYQALRQGIESAPEVGAAFCQQSIVSTARAELLLWHSWAERETPGVIEDWLERIALECRVQFSAMTVRREVYETLGGFCPDAQSAFDWEMWTRIATRYPVFYVPELLVGVGRDETAETSRLIRTGEQIRDAFAALDIAARHLPADRAELLVNKSRERLAAYALEVAGRYQSSGDAEAVLANLRAAVAGRPSARTRRRIMEFLQGERHEFEG